MKAKMKLRLTKNMLKTLKENKYNSGIGYIQIFAPIKNHVEVYDYFTVGEHIPHGTYYRFNNGSVIDAEGYVGLSYTNTEWSKIIFLDCGVLIVGERLFKEIMKCKKNSSEIE